MSEEPFSPVPFEFRKTCWTAVFMSWLLSGQALCLIGPAVVVLAINAVSDFLSILDIIGICGGAITIRLIVQTTNQSEDAPDTDYI
jgi:hypothetical protein